MEADRQKQNLVIGVINLKGKMLENVAVKN